MNPLRHCLLAQKLQVVFHQAFVLLTGNPCSAQRLPLAGKGRPHRGPVCARLPTWQTPGLDRCVHALLPATIRAHKIAVMLSSQMPVVCHKDSSAPFKAR